MLSSPKVASVDTALVSAPPMIIPLRFNVAASVDLDFTIAFSSRLRCTATAVEGCRGADEGWALGEGPGATACRA